MRMDYTRLIYSLECSPKAMILGVEPPTKHGTLRGVQSPSFHFCTLRLPVTFVQPFTLPVKSN